MQLIINFYFIITENRGKIVAILIGDTKFKLKLGSRLQRQRHREFEKTKESVSSTISSQFN